MRDAASVYTKGVSIRWIGWNVRNMKRDQNISIIIIRSDMFSTFLSQRNSFRMDYILLVHNNKKKGYIAPLSSTHFNYKNTTTRLKETKILA